jgi:HK97 family phage major capsid protein
VKHDERIEEVRANLKQAEEDEERAQRVAETARELGTTGDEERVQVGSEPETYRQGGSTPTSATSWRSTSTGRRHPRGAGAARAQQPRGRGRDRALTTTDGAGGDFVPPLWMVNQYVELARTARPTADRVRNETLPTGTDQINVPKILTGTAVAEQATQNTAVQNTDATTGAVAANVATLAGQQVIAVQLIEQSPINMDTILLQDLAFDYAAKVDLFVLNNNAAGKKGLLQETGTNAITYTTGSPTVALLYSKLADAIQQVTTNRFMPPDTIVMHPRRWASLLAAVDTAGRPLFIANTARAAGSTRSARRTVWRRGERRGRSGRRPRRGRGPADPDQPRCGHQPGPDHRVPRVGLDPLGRRAARRGVPRDQGRPAVGPAALLPLRRVHHGAVRQERQRRQRHRPRRPDLLI